MYSTSSSCSINTWLDSLPDQSENRSHPVRKRQRLAEITGNTMAPKKRTPSSTPRDSKLAADAQQSRHRLATNQGKQQDVEEEIDEDQDLEQTPRAGPLNPPALGRPPPPSISFGSPRSKPPSSASTGSSSYRSSRTGSPTKDMADFQFADILVLPKPWSASAVPPELKDLAKDIQRITKGKGVIPEQVKEELSIAGEDMEDVVCLDESEGNESDRSGQALFRHSVGVIQKATFECLGDNDPESSWNSEVHTRVLRLALEENKFAPEVWYKDITSARISDASLLPMDSGKGVMQAKLVDYAIIINPSTRSPSADTSLHRRIIEKLRLGKPGMGINQTHAEWVRFKPIAINIETKRGAIDDERTHVQLSTWLIAHFKRLRQLTIEPVDLPSMPVLSVQGKTWLLLIANFNADGNIYLIEDIPLGTTASILGIYQIIAALRRLVRWVHEAYRPWFEREVLGMISY